MSAFDRCLFEWIHFQARSGALDAVMPFVTKLDNFLIPMALLWVFLFWRGGARTRATLLVVLVAVGVSDLISSHVIKTLVARVRPCHVIEGVTTFGFSCKSSWSFPSSHAVNVACACTVIGYGFARRWLWPVLALIVLLVGISRVYVGMHYPLDVVGGWVIGAAVGVASFPAIARLSLLPWIARAGRTGETNPEKETGEENSAAG